MEATLHQVMELFDEYMDLGAKPNPEVMLHLLLVREPGKIADQIAQHVNAQYAEKQKILQETNVLRRLELLVHLLHHELQVLRMEA